MTTLRLLDLYFLSAIHEHVHLDSHDHGDAMTIPHTNKLRNDEFLMPDLRKMEEIKA